MEPDALLKSLELVLAEDQRRVLRVGGDPPRVYERYGVSAEIASVIAEGAFYHLDAPVRRIGAMDVPVPFSPVLEDLTVPSSSMVFEAAKALCRKA